MEIMSINFFLSSAFKALKIVAKHTDYKYIIKSHYSLKWKKNAHIRTYKFVHFVSKFFNCKFKVFLFKCLIHCCFVRYLTSWWTSFPISFREDITLKITHFVFSCNCFIILVFILHSWYIKQICILICIFCLDLCIQ